MEAFLKVFCAKHDIPSAKFTSVTLADLSALHPGAIFGLGITESQLKSWQEEND